MRVAAHLHIPFRTLDAGAEYKKSVIDYLLAEYRAGRTPNPDVMCNREIKFGVFYRYAINAGANAIATGHYRNGEKNQTYFLWAVPKDVLAKTVFPVGQMEKREVRALAKKFGLPVAEKKDSQGICFLGSVSVKDFLRQELGSGNDALLYTLGERVPRAGGPWYVLEKDVVNKKLVVGKERALRANPQKGISFHSANWFSEPTSATSAQYRYRGVRIAGHVEGDAFIPDAPLTEPIAAGQSLVFYRDAECVGGGIIAP